MERPNVLIGVSGNGWYLTTLINQNGLKRLEAERDRKGERDYASAVCQAGPLRLPVLLPHIPSTNPLTPSQQALSHSATEPQGAK